MKYEEIQEMLDRYWEGETTIEEERSLKSYFNAGPVDPRFSQIAPLFQAIREEQKVQLTTKAKAASIRPQMYHWAVAASIALLLSAGWWMFQKENSAVLVAVHVPEQASQPIQTPAVLEPPKTALAFVNKPAQKTSWIRKKTSKKIGRTAPAIDAETAMAMAEIKAALALVSSKLDKGRSEAIKGASHLEAMDKVPKRKAG
jgi:predicted transcriptional regulator